MQSNPSSVIKFSPIKFCASQIITIENWKDCCKSRQTLTFPAFRSENDLATVEWKLSIRPTPRHLSNKACINASVTRSILGERPRRFSVVSLTVRIEYRNKDGESCNKSGAVSFDIFGVNEDEYTVFLATSNATENWETWRDMRVKCDIEYINGFTTAGASSKASISTAAVDATLPENFLSMLDSGNGADVTFRVDGANIPAHKLILSARSDYFRRMFDAGMKEAETGVVDIEDVDVDIFRGLLRFIYSGILPPPSVETVTKLLVAAERYGLAPLKESCAEAIADDVTVDNACETLVLADTHACANLKKKCVETIKKNWNTITKQDAWKEVKKDAALLSEIVDALSE